MISAESQAVAEKSTALYESQLRANLEEAHRGKYVSIEPLSGRYFLGDSFDEAVNAALDECPGCLTLRCESVIRRLFILEYLLNE